MKTKNKTLALMEIAVVLCSLFFVALSATAIAAEQNVLDIYGNANEDDTIDMRDLTYVKLIFFGKKPETELADAKYDGKINPLDFIQIKLIIVGKEKELTIVDTADRIVTLDMPVERVVVTYHGTAAVIKALEAEDKVVGVSDHIKGRETLFPVFSKLPCVGYAWGPDAESIIALESDLVIYQDLAYGGETLIEQLELVGIPVIIFTTTHYYKYWDVVKEFGYIFGVPDKADEYIDWYQGHVDIIAERVEGLSEEDKPRVLKLQPSGGGWVTPGSDLPQYHLKYELAGGISISADLPGTAVSVDPEWVIEQNPEIVVTNVASAGYDTDDVSEMIAGRDEIMSYPGFGVMDVVKEGEVYVTSYEMDTVWFAGVTYLAKWFHPELFEDLDPNAIHQEWLTDFMRIDYDLDEHGVFVYHPEKHPDGR